MVDNGILVQISFGIGNAIMKTPMLIALRRLYPKVAINVWCCHAPAYETLVGLREHWNQPEPLFNIQKREESFGGHSIAVITAPADDTFRRSAIATRYIEHSKEGLDLFDGRHEVEVNMDLVRQLGYKGPTPAPRIHIPKETQQKMDNELIKYQFGKYRAVVAFHCGSLDTDLWKKKRWPEDKMSALIEKLKLENILPIIIGTKNDVRMVIQGAVNFVDHLTIKETAAVLSRCSLLISTDSGPAHLADAVGTPSLVLFGPTYPEKNKPYLYGEFITAGKKCSPCYWTPRMEKCAAAECMNEITVDMVLERSKKWL